MQRWQIFSVVVLAALLLAVRPATAHVSVNLGFNFSVAPQLVPLPGSPVMYAPAAPSNYFFYAGSFYVFNGGAWYVSSGYNGPWVALAPAYVPRPLLGVPVRYYHVPPRAWRRQHGEIPPPWRREWGRSWAEHEELHHHHEEHR